MKKRMVDGVAVELDNLYIGTINTIHSDKPSKYGNVGCFVLFNGGDFFGGSLWLTKTQADQVEVGQRIAVTGNIKIVREDKSHSTYVNVIPSAIKVKTEEGWLDITEESVMPEADLPF